MEFFNRAQSEDLPHVSGIKTLSPSVFDTKFPSEDLPHVSGIKTESLCAKLFAVACRKTCPTNRGLRHADFLILPFVLSSEDLPHQSGIKTQLLHRYSYECQSEDLSHQSGIKIKQP